MRYVVQSETLDKVHPLWPNQKCYYIVDILGYKRPNPFTIYTTLEAAQDRCNKKNSK